MSAPVHYWPVVTTVSIDVFSPFTTNIRKELRSFVALSDVGTGNKLVEGMLRLWNRERDKQDVRDRCDPKLKDLGSKYRKPRTSDLEPSSVSPVPRVSREYRDTPFDGLKASRACRGSSHGNPSCAIFRRTAINMLTHRAMVMEWLAIFRIASEPVRRGSGGWHAGPCRTWQPQR